LFQGFAKANFIFAKANLKNVLTFWGYVAEDACSMVELLIFNKVAKTSFKKISGC